MIAALFLRLGLPSRWAGILAWAVPVLLLVAFVVGCIVVINRDANKRVADAVASDRNAISVDAMSRSMQASAAADANIAAQSEVDQSNDREVRDAVRNGDASNVGPGVRDVLSGVRRQQQAGHR